MIIFSLPRYLTTKYQLTDDAFILRRGVFRRQLLHINYNKIQTVQREQWFFLRPFKLESLLIETAAKSSGDEPEVKLAVVSMALGAELERRRQRAKQPNVAVTMPEVRVAEGEADDDAPTAWTYQHTLSLGELVKYAITSLGFIPSILAVLAALQYVDDVPIVAHWMNQNLAHLAVVTVIMMVVSSVLMGVLISFGILMARYWRFTVQFDGSTVATKKGLFRTNSVSAPVRRIQAVRFQQNIIRGLLKRGTAQVVLASAVGKAENDDDMVLYPMLTKHDVWRRLHRLVSWLPGDQPTFTTFKTGRIAIVRNTVWFPLLVAGVLTYFFHYWGLLAFIWVAYTLACALFAVHARGAVVSDNILFISSGSMLVRSEFAVTRSHVQSLEVRQSWWMKKTKLVHVVVHVRKGDGDEEVKLEYVPEAMGRQLYTWYLGPAALASL